MLQEWVKYKGLRVIIVFEGRDAAGKGGTIKAITERVSPRVFRVVALPAPSDRERRARCMSNATYSTSRRLVRSSFLIAVGTTALASSMSWGFCTPEEYHRFLDECPQVEQYIVRAGIQLIKFWLEVGNQEQARRFEARIEDPPAAVEAESHRPGIAAALVRLLAGTRPDAGHHRHGLCAVVHRALGRQAPRAPETALRIS